MTQYIRVQLNTTNSEHLLSNLTSFFQKLNPKAILCQKRLVLYFNWQMGASNAVHWSKSAFSALLHLFPSKTRKRWEKGKIQQKEVYLIHILSLAVAYWDWTRIVFHLYWSYLLGLSCAKSNRLLVKIYNSCCEKI